MTDRIVIGVDFGTTFSGVAEAYSGKLPSADDIKVIKTWPGGNNITSDKVPSEIAYVEVDSANGDGEKKSQAPDLTEQEEEDWSVVFPDFLSMKEVKASLDTATATTKAEKVIRWGFQLRPDEQRLRCMKLFLDPRQDTPSFLSRSETRELLAKCGKDVPQVVADYLHEIYKHAKAQLVTRYGELFVDTTDLQWVLTVPAVWSDDAKDAILKAAKKAGMGPELTLISEPEAAAVYALLAEEPHHMKVGDNYVICDAGGGTVDLISHEILQLKPLRIQESVEGSGACCGASFLNVAFEQYFKSKLGNGQKGEAKFDRLRREHPKFWPTAMRFFEEYVKKHFEPTDQADFDVPVGGLPDDKEAGIEQGYLTLPSADVASMFVPLIKQIIKLVEGQMKAVAMTGKQVAGLILVGGFGQSPCLHKALKAYFHPGNRSLSLSNRFEVMQPAHAWTAVARGAVLRGLEGEELVISRKARRHYGIRVNTTFVEGVHPQSCKYYDDLYESYRAGDRMSWFISKGDTVSSTTPISLPFNRTFRGSHKTTTTELTVCDHSDAPAGGDEGRTRVLCSMKVDFANVPEHLFVDRENSSGTQYQTLSHDIGMQIQSGGLKFDLRVDDVVYGEVLAAFD